MHHSDRGVQYVSIRYTERLAEAGIEPSVGSRGDSYDNALAESIIGRYKTEVTRRRGLCLLFIHPGAPNLISLRSAALVHNSDRGQELA